MTQKLLLSAIVPLMIGLLYGMRTPERQIRVADAEGSAVVCTAAMLAVTYRIDEEIVRYGDGSFKCRMYNLMVSNHTDEALYVKGTFHRRGDAARVSGYFAETVYAGQTKCLHDEIDTPFEVLELEYEEALL